MKNEVTFEGMIDLALASPEIGAVNFNVLQQFLHQLVKKLNCGQEKISVSINEGDLKQQSVKGSDQTTPGSGVGSNYATLMKRVDGIEGKLNDFESKFPGAEEILAGKRGKGDSGQPVSDMWKFIQLQKRCDASEAGVEKVTELVESLMNKIAKLEDEKEKMMAQLQELVNIQFIHIFLPLKFLKYLC